MQPGQNRRQQELTVEQNSHKIVKVIKNVSKIIQKNSKSKDYSELSVATSRHIHVASPLAIEVLCHQ